MNLHELIDEYPHLFYRQEWYRSELFMYRQCAARDMPAAKVQGDARESDATAVELAALYVESTTHPIFRDYLWTSDMDQQGQRVYVGGTANGKGFEIHRHLRLTERWGIPIWH